MIQLATILPPTPPSSRPNSAAAGILSGEFAESFAAAGDGPGLDTATLVFGGEVDAKRQDAAVPGNALPPVSVFSIDPVARWQPAPAMADAPPAVLPPLDAALILPALGKGAPVLATGLVQAVSADNPAGPITIARGVPETGTPLAMRQPTPRYVPTPVALPEAGKDPATAQTDAGEHDDTDLDGTEQDEGDRDDGKLATPHPGETATTTLQLDLVPLPTTPAIVTTTTVAPIMVAPIMVAPMPSAAAIPSSSTDVTVTASIDRKSPDVLPDATPAPRPMAAGSRVPVTPTATKERTATPALSPIVEPLAGAPRVVAVVGAPIPDPLVQAIVEPVAAKVVRPPITVPGKAEAVRAVVSPGGAIGAFPRIAAGELLHEPAVLPLAALPTGTLAPIVAPVLPSASPAAATAVPMPAFVAPRLDGRQDAERPLSAETSPSAKMLPQIAIAPLGLAPAPLRSGTIASAAEVFGTAILSATNRKAPERLGDTDARTFLTSGLYATLEVARVAETSQAPLDMRQQTWPHAMIERIEMLRDAANAVDTRIRLIPDALGPIDISVKTSGDTVHVHFNAEQAATRTLLQDAQPRLAELAEARGLKLGQGSIGSGAAGAGTQDPGHRTPTTPQPRMPTAPVRAVAAATTDTDDIRIA